MNFKFSNFGSLMSHGGFKIALKASVLFAFIMAFCTVMLSLGGLETRSAVKIFFSGDLFTVLTDNKPLSAFAIKGMMASGKVIVDSSNFSSVMIFVRLAGLYAMSSLLSASAYCTMTLVESGEADGYFGSARSLFKLTGAYCILVGLLYFVVSIPLSYAGVAYYPLSCILKVFLLPLPIIAIFPKKGATGTFGNYSSFIKMYFKELAVLAVVLAVCSLIPIACYASNIIWFLTMPMYVITLCMAD